MNIARFLMAFTLLVGCGDGITLSPETDAGATDLAVSSVVDGSVDQGPKIDGSPSDGSDLDVTAHPPLESSLILWLDPEVGVSVDATNVVSAWTDRSAHASIDVFAGSVEAITRVPVTFGSKPAIRSFSGGLIRATFSSAVGTRRLSIFFVARTLTPMSAYVLFHTYPGDVFMQKRADDTARTVITGAPAFAVSPGVSDVGSKARIFAIRRKDADVEMRIDGISMTETDPKGPDAMPNAMDFSPGLLGEALVYDADLSDNDVAAVEAYLKAKYAL